MVAMHLDHPQALHNVPWGYAIRYFLDEGQSCEIFI